MENTYVYTAPMPIVDTLSAFVTVPTDFDPAVESLPVILFLHGAGERGDNVDLVRFHGVPKLFEADPNYHGLRVITISPQCPDKVVWNHLTYPLMDWFMTFVNSVNGDKTRLSVTGLSMGGFGTWDVITTFPHIFACAAPICGGGMTWRADALRGKPLRVYHGTDDNCVSFFLSQEMVKAARDAGADVELVAYDRVGHGSWIPAYEQTDLIEWLVSQRLDTASSGSV